MAGVLWRGEVSAGKPASFSSQTGTLEILGCTLVSGQAAALYVAIDDRMRYALGSFTAARPHDHLRVHLYEDAVFSCEGGTLQLHGMLRRPPLSDGSMLLSADEIAAGFAAAGPTRKRPRTVDDCTATSEAPAPKVAKVAAPASSQVGKAAVSASPKVAQALVPASSTHAQAMAPTSTRVAQGVTSTSSKVAQAAAPASPKVTKAPPPTSPKGVQAAVLAPPPSPMSRPALSPGAIIARRRLPSGVEYEVLRVGKGEMARPAKIAVVRYEGRLAKTGQLFDKGDIKFRLGMGEVIQGWDEGVKGMLRGERRRLHVPSRLGYGTQGATGAIPPHADLVFEVELLQC